MEYKLFKWILCIVVIQRVTTVQEFETMPRDVDVNPGETAHLTCKVRNRGGECAWLRNGIVVGRIPEKYQFVREPPDGDCSIDVVNSQLDEDDGTWQCQVTQGSLHDPTLTSNEIRLTVRVAPLPPRIEDNTIQIPPGETLTARAKESKRLHCVSRRGNPPALLKWYIGDEEITSMSNQTNATDVDKMKTWQASSLLDYVFQKEDNKKTLKCLAIHEAYLGGPLDISVPLEVLYPPEIRLEGQPEDDIEEGMMVSLKCLSDANPKANIIWKKSGHSGLYDVKAQIDFNPINRIHTGNYSCLAKNDIGQSEELIARIDVKYKPRIVKVDPSQETIVSLYSVTSLQCIAEGNPQPRYSWLQKLPTQPESWKEKARNATLYIQNVSYAYQGIYMCEASNIINNEEEKDRSEEVRLDVTGAPQILRDITASEERVVVEKDEDASIIIYFCSDPRPQRTFWEWGSQKLEAGTHNVRHVAEPLLPDEKQDDCYSARLIVQKVDGTDSRKYTLNIENEKGRESYAVALEVKEPVSLSVVIGIVVGCIALFIIIVLVVIYLLKAEKWCFNRHRGFSPESDSELGLPSQNGRNTSSGAIPPDALYANLKPENGQQNKTKGDAKEGIVYANLDLPPPTNDSKPQKSPQEKTQYAEIQFQPKRPD